MKIAIIGLGYVGSAYKTFFERRYDVVTYDPKINKKYPEKLINSCDLAVICVPTNSTPDGSCDVSIVNEMVQKISTPLILIKSTVEPGTTDRLIKETQKRICFSPEYIGESKYFQPYWNEVVEQPFVVVGGENSDANEIISIFEYIMGPTKAYHKCSALDAEIIKYMENCFFATKVTFVNEFYNICQSLGADWYKVREGWLLDPRINKMHTSVFKQEQGFAAKCFPKDLYALIKRVKKSGYQPDLLEQVAISNVKFRKNTSPEFSAPIVKKNAF